LIFGGISRRSKASIALMTLVILQENVNKLCCPF
jgi:hypothetical protein